MKLHLPKLLRVAVMVAMGGMTVAQAEIQTKKMTATDGVEYTYYNVGYATPRITGEQQEEYVGNLTLNDKEIVGAFKVVKDGRRPKNFSGRNQRPKSNRLR